MDTQTTFSYTDQSSGNGFYGLDLDDEKIALIQDRLAEHESVSWIDIFKECRSRIELVCCLLAILELCRMGRVRAHQHHTFGDIRLFATRESAAG